MINIYLINEGKSYLPEVGAYKTYFASGDRIRIFDSQEHDFTNNYDLIWRFMGLSTVKTRTPEIHEYVSLSTGRFPRYKDKIKKAINIQPIFRIFQNDYIMKKMNFCDGVKYIYRPMGVDEEFYNIREDKKFDFVYMGSISKSRKTENILQLFKEKLKNHSILIIGSIHRDLISKYKNAINISFTGRVPHKSVPQLASSAQYGINYIPLAYPYQFQASTKFLEYLALNLKVITTSSEWTNDFQSTNGGRYFFINENLDNFNFKDINAYNYLTPSMEQFKWTKVIRDSKLEQTIISCIKG